MTDIKELVKRLRLQPARYERDVFWSDGAPLDAADALEAQEKEIEKLTKVAVKEVSYWATETGKRDARIAELDAALVDVTARLVAAVSLLERGGKKAAPSNRMFNQMIVDYKNCIERSRAALNGERG